jgi:acetylornithine deacetylase
MAAVPSDPLAPESVLDLLGRLVAIPSVNPAIAPEEAHGEAEIAAFACRWLSERGVRAWLEEAAPGRPNAVAEVGEGDGPTLVLCAHIDTVGTAGMTIPPFDPRRADGRLYGRGSYDMKCGAAAAMATAPTAASSPSRAKAGWCSPTRASSGCGSPPPGAPPTAAASISG